MYTWEVPRISEFYSTYYIRLLILSMFPGPSSQIFHITLVFYSWYQWHLRPFRIYLLPCVLYETSSLILTSHSILLSLNVNLPCCTRPRVPVNPYDRRSSKNLDLIYLICPRPSSSKSLSFPRSLYFSDLQTRIEFSKWKTYFPSVLPNFSGSIKFRFQHKIFIKIHVMSLTNL